MDEDDLYEFSEAMANQNVPGIYTSIIDGIAGNCGGIRKNEGWNRRTQHTEEDCKRIFNIIQDNDDILHRIRNTEEHEVSGQVCQKIMEIKLLMLESEFQPDDWERTLLYHKSEMIYFWWENMSDRYRHRLEIVSDVIEEIIKQFSNKYFSISYEIIAK